MKNTNIYNGYRYPSSIISHAVWLYHSFTLSLCDIEALLAARGVKVSYRQLRNYQKLVPESYSKGNKPCQSGSSPIKCVVIQQH
jgi:transposase-like protein